MRECEERDNSYYYVKLNSGSLNTEFELMPNLAHITIKLCDLIFVEKMLAVVCQFEVQKDHNQKIVITYLEEKLGA